MHAVKVDSRKIMAAGLVIVAVFAAVAITVNLFYLGQIQSLVRNTTTTSVMELATARAHYLDECLASDQNSVKSLAHFIADVTPQEARDQVKDFISTHEAAAAWIRSKDGSTWCSSSETDLYDPALEDELFGPAMAAHLGKGFIAVRKAGKLPPETIGESYDLEYGTASVEIETDAVQAGKRVLIVDDLIATGGTAKAATDLIEKAGGTVVGFSFVMRLDGLDGLDKLDGKPSSSLIAMPA